MTLRTMRYPVLLVALLGAAACGPKQLAHGPVPNALDSRVDWFAAETSEGRDARGAKVDEVPMRGGEVVRLTVNGNGPITIGERVRSGAGFAESWTQMTPQNGVITLRTSLLGTAILAPKGTIAKVHVGLGHDPGYEWFTLEDTVLAWADGPLPAPFPAIAPKERIDFAGFDALDRVLAAAVDKASDKTAARESASAIRRVVGLRAVRAIRPNEGFPYYYDNHVKPEGDEAPTDVNGRKTWLVQPNKPLTLVIEGPRILEMSSYGVRNGDDASVTVNVLEGSHVRAKSGGVLSHVSGAPETQTEADPQTTGLRRAVVHVPPGSHRYTIETKGGSILAAFQLSKAAVHIGDGISGAKDETRQLEKAKATHEPTLLAIANALAGTDSSLDGLGKEARAVATTLSEGGPHDPLVDLELRAAHGDPHALAALGDAARTIVDDGVRSAWLRGTTRGTRWVVADTNEIEAGRRWLSMIVPGTTPECEKASAAPWTEIGVQETTYASSIWRGAHAMELMAATSCAAAGPVMLEVDGTKISATPSSALARWHVLVRGETAKIKRTDGPLTEASGRVWGIRAEAASCGAHWGYIGAPRIAKDVSELSWGTHVTAPGAEVWVREGNPEGEIQLVSKVDPHKRVTVRSAAGTTGFNAMDDVGHRWVRVARVALPAWAAADGVTVIGSEMVAVRAIVRAPKAYEDPAGQATATPDGEVAEAEALDENKLIAASRAVNGATGAARGKAYFERAMMLARGGEARAAMEDARAAKLLGAKAPEGDVVAYVRAAIRIKARKPLALPDGIAAYGIEPDFDAADPKAARCVPSHDGPRAKLAAVVDELKAAKTAKAKLWDPNLAIRAWEAASTNAADPRSSSVLSWALAGSRWQVPKAIDTALLKVQRPHEIGGGPSLKEGAIDPDGDLRARIATGMPFDRSSYATVVEGRPAKVALTGSNGVKAHVEIACVPRSPGDALDYSSCPVTVTVGTTAMPVSVSADGRANVELPTLPNKGPGASATISMGPSPGRFVAVARVVFDGEVPGTTKVDGVGYVVMPDGLQWRYLVKAGEELKTSFAGPGLLRIDARKEPEESPQVVVVIDGKPHLIPVDGSPQILPIPSSSSVVVRSVGGASTITLAERVAKPALADLVTLDAIEADPYLAEEAPSPSTTAVLSADDPNAPWRDTVEKSPRPLTSFEENFGTVTAHTLARYGTLRDGSPRGDEPDHYFETSVGYRRRIESIDLWTGVTGVYRPRDGNDSAGGSLFLYKTVSPLRLRLAAWVDGYAQKIGLTDARTFHPHGYAELSLRVTPNLFILPRVGYDGFYSNLVERPISLDNVDDDIYNDFRARRNTLLYGQALSWWVPYFNSIIWTRTRVNFDAATRGLSHVSFRPGTYFAFDNVELDLFAEATWFAATEGLRTDSKMNYTGAAYVFYNNWYGNGSFDIQPGIGGRARANDGAWEVFAMINVLASFQRGLRDFASPELNFPEQFGGSVAWRGFVPGGMR